MTIRDARRTPSDYPTRAAAYRRMADTFRLAGDVDAVAECEEFARRCDELALSTARRPIAG